MFSWLLKYLNIFKSFCCLSLAMFFALALMSYNPADPSFNVITNADPENWAGMAGAYIADPILQIFGLAAFLLVMIFLCWAFVFYAEGEITRWFLRIVSGIIALNLASILLNFVNFSYSGGVAGILWNENLHSYGLPEEAMLLAVAGIFLISLYVCLALNNSTWLMLAKLIGNIITRIFRFIALLLQKLPKTAIAKEEVFSAIKSAVKTPPKFNANKIIAIEEPEKTIAVMNAPKAIVKKSPSVIYEQVINPNGFTLPSTNLLQDFPVNKDLIQKNNSVMKKHTEELLQVLVDFGVSGELVGAYSGPVVTLYELEPAAGTKSSRIVGLSDDIARSMRATSARIAVIPGRNAIGIELPNKQRETVYLKELLDSKEYRESGYDLPIILGKDIAGNVVVADLARMPHLLVAGTTGSGKSVAINTMILSLVYALTPEQCKFIMVDPKMLELSVYDGIPHLLTNVVTDPGKAVVALKWVVKEMENRYRLMSNLGVRNIHNYNSRIKEAIAKGEVMNRTVQTGFDAETGKPKIEQVPLDMKTLPFIVVIVDEMADLMLVAGIHIIMATQRPSVDVITGVIKANFPTRISFQVTSKIDSRTILGEQGAEQLLGKGDMLYMAGGSKITRIHGPFVADNEVEKIVSYLETQGQPDYMADITSGDESFSGVGSGNSGQQDELYQEAVSIVMQEGKASTSFIQRCLKIGYNRAASIIEQMEKEGIVSKPNHVGKRDILV